MAKGKGSFFPRNKSKESTKPQEPASEKKEYISFGAAWLYERDNDMPFFSVRIGKDDLERMVEHAKETEDGGLNCMMFPNNNQREGHKDPDYYLVPPLENR